MPPTDGLGAAEPILRTGDSGRGKDGRRSCLLPVVADLAGPTDLLKSGVGGVDFCIVLTRDLEGLGVEGECACLTALSRGKNMPAPGIEVMK